MKTLKNVLTAVSVFIAVVFVLSLFGQQEGKGNPFKEIWEKLNEIEGRIDEMDTELANASSDIDDLQSDLAIAQGAIDALEGRMTTVENEISSLEIGLRPPDYDSGWFNFDEITDPEATVTHRFDHFLGGDLNNYVVDIQAKSIGGNPHNVNYGSDWVYDPWVPGDLKFKQVGVYWSDLTTEHILVTRTLMDYTDDMPADYVRVRIWIYED